MDKKHATSFIAKFVCLLLLAALMMPFIPRSAQAVEGSPLAADYDPQFAVDWMNLLYDRVEAEGVSAPGASRLYAYAGITLYEAVLHGIPGNNSLAWQINDMPDMPYPDEDKVYNWSVVATIALDQVLTALFPDSTESAEAFHALRDQQLAGYNAEALSTRYAVEYGNTLGEALVNWIETDHFLDTRTMTYELPAGDPALWIPTAENQRAVEPYWGQIRPFALEYTDQCAVELNMPFSTEETSAFYAQAVEVMETGMALTQEQKDTAEFWVDTPGQTGTPAGHWVQIENQLVDQLDLTLDRAAGMYALVGIALADSFISCWSLKYQVLLLRPESYIKQYVRQSWSPYIATPGFPAYPSGHSVVSGAAATVLTDLFGVVYFTDASHTDRGLAPRSFTSFVAAANEAAISRLYGGIHFRVDIENGLIQGNCVGRSVVNRIALRPVPQGE